MALFTPSESPAIVVKEIDLTGGVPNVQSSTGAVVGNFRRGPVNEPVLIANEAQLVEVFGAPDSTNTVDFHSAAYFLKYSNSLYVVRSAGSTAVNATDPSGTAAAINNETAFAGATLTGKIFARHPGSIGNSLKVETAGTSDFSGWTYEAFFDAAPAANEQHIVVIDEGGTITGKVNTVLETYPFLSENVSASNDDGSTNYIKDVINRRSSYIWINTVPTAGDELSFSGGDDDAPGQSDLISSFDLLADKDALEIDFLIAPQMANRTDQTAVVNDLVEIAASTRKDCVVITSPARSDIVNSSTPHSNAITTAQTFTTGSYLFIDNNFLKVYDKYNDAYIFIPAASSTAGIMAASDRADRKSVV